MTEHALEAAAIHAARFVRGLAERPVAATAGAEELRDRLGGPLPDGPSDPAEVVAELAKLADDGLVASAGPRYFGFVVGGGLPAALAADWLAAAWDQNAGLFVLGPAAATVEDVAAGWLLDLLGLPSGASTGFVTGGLGANFSGLAAARNAVLAGAGWDVERDGLAGGPPVEVVVGAERHVTIDIALRYLGLGSGRLRVVPADGQGRMVSAALPEVLAACQGPTIVCAQAGNVNTGAFDPLAEICDIAHARGAWVHVDGAFGLWAAASPARRHLVAGVERADSVATDAHKWLNVPYDSGLVFVARPEAHLAAFAKVAAYFVPGRDAERDPDAFTRRRRGGPGGSRCGRRCARWGVRAWPTWSSAAAATPAASPTPSGPSMGSRSSTRSSSTRCWSASPTRAAIPTAAPTRSSAGSRPAARSGLAAPPGTAWRPCASCCRTGQPPTTTSTAR
jgi:hypothetical protein